MGGRDAGPRAAASWPLGSFPAAVQVPGVGPATERLGHRSLRTAAAQAGPPRPRTHFRQAATGRDGPPGRTSACSRRPARPRVRGCGPLCGARRPLGAAHPRPPGRRMSGGEALRPHVAARQAHPLGGHRGRAGPDRELERETSAWAPRSRVNYLSCS